MKFNHYNLQKLSLGHFAATKIVITWLLFVWHGKADIQTILSGPCGILIPGQLSLTSFSRYSRPSLSLDILQNCGGIITDLLNNTQYTMYIHMYTVKEFCPYAAISNCASTFIFSAVVCTKAEDGALWLLILKAFKVVLRSKNHFYFFFGFRGYVCHTLP